MKKRLMNIQGGNDPMGLMAPGGKFYDGNAAHWCDQTPPPSFPRQTCSENTNWETAAVQMSVAEEYIKKATGRFNRPMECWGCTNYPRYNADRFHTYINYPKIGTRTLMNRKICQFKSMINVLPSWE